MQKEKGLRNPGARVRIPTNIMFILRFFTIQKQYIFVIYNYFRCQDIAFTIQKSE
jgi:hypothetical protein